MLFLFSHVNVLIAIHCVVIVHLRAVSVWRGAKTLPGSRELSIVHQTCKAHSSFDMATPEAVHVHSRCAFSECSRMLKSEKQGWMDNIKNSLEILKQQHNGHFLLCSTIASILPIHARYEWNNAQNIIILYNTKFEQHIKRIGSKQKKECQNYGNKYAYSIP